MASASDVIHFDALTMPVGMATLLAVTILPRRPTIAQQREQFVIASPRTQRGAQIKTRGGKQTGVQHAVRGQPGARAITTEWLRDR
jgi:hypothetical protein